MLTSSLLSYYSFLYLIHIPISYPLYTAISIITYHPLNMMDSFVPIPSVSLSVLSSSYLSYHLSSTLFSPIPHFLRSSHKILTFFHLHKCIDLIFTPNSINLFFKYIYYPFYITIHSCIF